MKVRLIEDITPDQVDLTGFIPQRVLNGKLWIDNKLNQKVRIHTEITEYLNGMKTEYTFYDENDKKYILFSCHLNIL